MPFDHNDHYHRLLLRRLPPGGRTAPDVGCGTGRFAVRLARRGYAVDALDPSAEVIAAAAGPRPAMRLPEIRTEAARLPPGAEMRQLLFWRYLLTYRAPAGN